MDEMEKAHLVFPSSSATRSFPAVVHFLSHQRRLLLAMTITGRSTRPKQVLRRRYSMGAPAALFDGCYRLRSWIDVGVPREQLIMGLRLFGKTWKLRDPKIHGIGAPAVGVGPKSGALRYAEVVEFNQNNNAVVVFDEATVSAYSVTGDSWVGYDDEETVQKMIGYAKRLGLRSYFFWAMNGYFTAARGSSSWPSI